MPVQQDMSPGCRRYLSDECQPLGVAGSFVFHQQPRKDSLVVVDDRIGDQPGTLVADFNLDVGTPS